MIHKIFSFTFKIIGIALCMLFWSTSWFWIMMVVYLLFGLGVMVYGSYNIKFNYHIKSVIKGGSKGVVLTFDDGPHPENTPKILEILELHNVKATFFLIGQKVEKYGELVKEIDRKGHIIANHSYSHHNFIPFFRAKKLKADFKHASDLIAEKIGKTPQWIRPPFGATSPRYFSMMRKVKWASIGWSIRSYDTVIKEPKQLKDKILQKIKPQKAPIILFHDTQHVTTEALPEILKELKTKGIKVVPLTKSVSIKPYE